MALADRQARFDDAALLLGEELRAGSVYPLLAEHGDQLFGDGYFANLFARSRLGRPTVAARVVATAMLLQAHEGLFRSGGVRSPAFDLRCKAAAGLAVAAGSSHPTVLVGMRNRLRESERPHSAPPSPPGTASTTAPPASNQAHPHHRSQPTNPLITGTQAKATTRQRAQSAAS